MIGNLLNLSCLFRRFLHCRCLLLWPLGCLFEFVACLWGIGLSFLSLCIGNWMIGFGLRGGILICLYLWPGNHIFGRFVKVFGRLWRCLCGFLRLGRDSRTVVGLVFGGLLGKLIGVDRWFLCRGCREICSLCLLGQRGECPAEGFLE